MPSPSRQASKSPLGRPLPIYIIRLFAPKGSSVRPFSRSFTPQNREGPHGLSSARLCVLRASVAIQKSTNSGRNAPLPAIFLTLSAPKPAHLEHLPAQSDEEKIPRRNPDFVISATSCEDKSCFCRHLRRPVQTIWKSLPVVASEQYRFQLATLSPRTPIRGENCQLSPDL
jgi:hypothetical protein